MLDILRRIVQEVSAATDLEHALRILVSRVKQAMAVDVCSAYLADPGSGQYVLMATDGLNPAAVGRVRLERGEGLVSIVGSREEPLNLEDAPSHPAYKAFPETDEIYYHAFLGVPIIHHRKIMGVLVVRQRERRRFDEDEVALLVTTAAQLAGAIAHAEASGDIAKLLSGQDIAGRYLEGLPGAPGVAVGTVMVVYPSADLDAVPDRIVDDVEAEVAVFRHAVEQVRKDVQSLADSLTGQLAREDRALFDAYLMMLDSDSLFGKTVDRIRAGSWASGALRETIKEHAAVFDAMEDPYLRERANDVRDLGRRVLLCIQSGERNAPPYPPNTILVGEELSAATLAEVPAERLAGVVSVRGSTLSHLAILANALGIPAVVGVDDLPVSRIDHCEMIVDGYRGRIYLSPSNAVREEYIRLAREEADLMAGLENLRDLPAETTDGVRIPLLANTGLISDLKPSLNCGAEGIGLYRTEFPFMIRDRFPGEEEQRQIYRQTLEAFAPRPVTLRTLDVGGDKPLSYFPINEDNPFLGWRGIRVTLDHPEIFLVQLRAMMRAGAGLGNLRILLPMVSSVGELDEATALLRRAYEELVADGEAVEMPQVGLMVEVPSAVYQIQALAKRVDFLSIGTNDLTQYLLAVDRNNPQVAGLYDSLHPAVIHAIRLAVDGAHAQGKTIGVCGEMAGDPAAAVVLVGLGVDCLSMSVASLPRIKWVVRNLSAVRAREALEHVLQMDDARSVRSYLDRLLEQAGVGGLVRAGK